MRRLRQVLLSLYKQQTKLVPTEPTCNFVGVSCDCGTRFARVSISELGLPSSVGFPGQN